MIPRLLLLLSCWFAASAQADPVTLPARAVTYQPELHAWARVQAVAALTLRMPLAARVDRLTALPGQRVAAGTPLVRLGGPRLAGEVAAARARVVAATRELAAAQQSAASAARTYPALINQRTLDAAQAAVAAAQGRLDVAVAAQRALRAQATLTSPLPAAVEKIDAVPGTDLPPGAPLLSLLPRGRVWLKAELFDTTPLPPGSTARFVPADGPAVAVRLADELPARATNGARILNFEPVAAGAPWQVGEAGELIIDEPPRSAVAVPAAALILDAGQWYVLVERAGKLAAQAVAPGPTRGDETLILQGLRSGTPVVVHQAYALYHHDLAAHYTPPD